MKSDWLMHGLSAEFAGRFRNTREAASANQNRGLESMAFILIGPGFLVQWPTLPAGDFPILMAMYARLAGAEEAEMRKHFGAAFDAQAQRMPRFMPPWRQTTVAS